MASGCHNNVQLQGRDRSRGQVGPFSTPTVQKIADQVLLEAVEKVQRLQAQTSLPSPLLSGIAGGPKDDEITNMGSAWKKNVEGNFNFEPLRPIAEPITPPKSTV